MEQTSQLTSEADQQAANQSGATLFRFYDREDDDSAEWYAQARFGEQHRRYLMWGVVRRESDMGYNVSLYAPPTVTPNKRTTLEGFEPTFGDEETTGAYMWLNKDYTEALTEPFYRLIEPADDELPPADETLPEDDVRGTITFQGKVEHPDFGGKRTVITSDISRNPLAKHSEYDIGLFDLAKQDYLNDTLSVWTVKSEAISVLTREFRKRGFRVRILKKYL